LKLRGGVVDDENFGNDIVVVSFLNSGAGGVVIYVGRVMPRVFSFITVFNKIVFRGEKIDQKSNNGRAKIYFLKCASRPALC
jgi:hypothetical protein